MPDVRPNNGGPLNVNSPNNFTNIGSSLIIPVEDLVTVDDITIEGDGTTLNPLRLVGGKSGGHRQTFRYVANGSESGQFTILLPSPRLNTNYNVQLTMGGPSTNSAKTIRAIVSSFTVTQFDVEPGGSLDSGDIIQITVEDLT